MKRLAEESHKSENNKPAVNSNRGGKTPDPKKRASTSADSETDDEIKRLQAKLKQLEREKEHKKTKKLKGRKKEKKDRKDSNDTD